IAPLASKPEWLGIGAVDDTYVIKQLGLDISLRHILCPDRLIATAESNAACRESERLHAIAGVIEWVFLALFYRTSKEGGRLLAIPCVADNVICYAPHA